MKTLRASEPSDGVERQDLRADNQNAPRIHELKCWPEFYASLLSGDKTFELRKDDRGYRVGDALWLREWRRLTVAPQTGAYTGREMWKAVTYVLSGWGLEPGYVCLGLGPHCIVTKPLIEGNEDNP